MKTLYKTFLVVAFFIVSGFTYGQGQKPQSTFVEDEFIVWLEQDVDAVSFAEQSNAGITPKRMLSKRLNIWLFEITDSKEPRADKMARLAQNVDVKLVQNNHTNIRQREAIPDDPGFSQQWAPRVMQLPEAWGTYTTGGVTATGDEIVVAVVDGGGSLNHEDLDYWENTHEIPNNGIDDDGNGYIDDYQGWNAFSHTGSIPSDNHGTHVAGIIGAIGNNGKGVCGVNWNVKIMPVKGNSSTESTVVEAYSYVLEMRARYNETHGAEGAFVVATNSSFGVDNGNPADYPIWCSMYDELGNVGILSCTAGPNNNVNVDVVGDIPSTCPGDYMIGITNTTSSDVKNSGAGYGTTHIDIGSPGTTIYSTTPGDGYLSMTGTSMATPQVTGTIALMYAAMPESMMLVCKSDPAAFSLMVRQYLLDGADHLPSLNGLVASSRRLNAFGAINRIFNDPVLPTLTGGVLISGETAFGQTLTAQASLGSTPPVYDLGELSYQWRRGTSLINGAVNPTYTLTEGDLGKWISVQVSASNCEGMVLSESIGPVTKGERPAPEAPQLESRTRTSITLVGTEGYEYNINGGAWQRSPVFDGLTPRVSYVFRQRIRETSTYFTSPASPEAVYSTTSNTAVDENASATFKVYPVPSQGSIIVEGTGSLVVSNVVGQIILTQEIDGQVTLDLPKGLYFAKMGNKVKKIVVE